MLRNWKASKLLIEISVLLKIAQASSKWHTIIHVSMGHWALDFLYLSALTLVISTFMKLHDIILYIACMSYI